MERTCIDPGVIKEGDLMAYVDGTASDEVIRHVQRCPACAHQAEELAIHQTFLTLQLYRFSCPPSDQLIAYYQGELAGNEKLSIAQHLRQCPHCARELATLARKEGEGLFRQARKALKMLEATRIVPSLRVAAVREGPARDRPAPLLYRAGELEVILTQQLSHTDPRRRDLSGLIHIAGRVPETIGEARAELWWGDGLIGVAQVSSHGHFAFTAIEPGNYVLRLIWEEKEIRLEEVKIR